jgi:hypothetical protein
MSFLRKLFGSEDPEKSTSSDPEGFFVYVACDHCGAKVRLRIHKQYDLVPTGDGYEWHKTIVDSRCFRQIPTVAHFDNRNNLVTADIQGGRFISKAEYDAPEVSQPTDEEEAGE